MPLRDKLIPLLVAAAIIGSILVLFTAAHAEEERELQMFCTAVAQPCMTCWWGYDLGDAGNFYIKQSEATPDPEPFNNY